MQTWMADIFRAREDDGDSNGWINYIGCNDAYSVIFESCLMYPWLNVVESRFFVLAVVDNDACTGSYGSDIQVVDELFCTGV